LARLVAAILFSEKGLKRCNIMHIMVLLLIVITCTIFICLSFIIYACIHNLKKQEGTDSNHWLCDEISRFTYWFVV